MFETCPRCSQASSLDFLSIKPMVLSGSDTEMQCDGCNKSFPLPISESLVEMARNQRAERYVE